MFQQGQEQGTKCDLWEDLKHTKILQSIYMETWRTCIGMNSNGIWCGLRNAELGQAEFRFPNQIFNI